MAQKNEKDDEILELTAEKDRYKNVLAERLRAGRKVVYADSPIRGSVGVESRGSVPPEERRSIQIPDPPVLTDGTDPDFEGWVLSVEDKLAANADHFSTPALRLAYVKSRCGGATRSTLANRGRW